MTRFLKVVVFASVFLMPAGAMSQTAVVSGQVTNEQGAGIALVDLDFWDTVNGEFIYTPNDNTDFGGFYSVPVPVAEYDIYYNPPVGSPYLQNQVHAFVTADTTINVTLLAGNLVTGYVTDLAGAPLYNVDLDFFDVVTGNEVFSQLPNDNTDFAGLYQILIESGTYQIRFTPPLGAPYAAAVLESVLIDTSVMLDTTRLEPGQLVSGTVLDPVGVPVSNTDLNFESISTGNLLYTPRDNTDGSGVYNVYVPADSFDILFRPPVGSGLAYKSVFNVPVNGDTTLAPVSLRTGYTASGVVTDGSLVPIQGADLDMIDLTTGRDLPTDHDATDGAGHFAMLAPPETLDLVIKPPPAVDVAAAVLRNQIITGDTDFGTIMLLPGFAIDGTVTDPLLQPVAGADIDLVEIGTGLVYPTPRDNTDSAGVYHVRVPGGSYLVIATPPIGSDLLPDTVTVDPLSSDLVIDFVLPSSAIIGVASGAPPAFESLYPNVPNPFNPMTEIRFRLAGEGTQPVSLLVYSSSGRLIRTLLRSELSAGEHAIHWDGSNDAGLGVASGVYFYVLETDRLRQSRKMTLMR